MTYKNIYIFSGFSKTVIGWWVWLKELGWQLAVFNLGQRPHCLVIIGEQMTVQHYSILPVLLVYKKTFDFWATFSIQSCLAHIAQ